MRTNKAEELRLRHKLRDAMKGKWHLTWHEDGRVNPGVPDASYVMKRPPSPIGNVFDVGGRFETGWLELKAIPKFDDLGMAKFLVEPSQIEWMRDHGPLIPVHFLVAVGQQWWLLEYTWSTALANVHMDHLFQHSLSHGTLSSLGVILPPVLQRITSRI